MGIIVHNAALKAKAKEMYVINGLSLHDISSLLPKISERTLRTWRKIGNWETQRKERVERTEDRRERIERALDSIIDAIKDKRDPKLVFSIGKLAAELKSISTFESTDETNQLLCNKKKELTPETLKEIEEKLGIL